MILIRLCATFCEVLTIFASMAATGVLFFGLSTGGSAIQEAAVAAIAVAIVAIPYTAAGAFHRMSIRAMKAEEVATLYVED